MCLPVTLRKKSLDHVEISPFNRIVRFFLFQSIQIISIFRGDLAIKIILQDIVVIAPKVLLRLIVYTIVHVQRNFDVLQNTTEIPNICMFLVDSVSMVSNIAAAIVVVAPKVLLRLPAAASTLAELSPGSTFSTVLSGTEPLVQQFSSCTTICPGSSDPFYIVSYYIKWVESL